MEEDSWRVLEQAHCERVTPWVSPRLQRRAAGLKHPVDDFLFDYYPFSPGRLRAWHPGYGVELEGDVGAFHVNPAYERTPSGGATASLGWLNPSRRARLALAVRILEGTSSRAANTGCFALHEWAMVYGVEQQQIRHEQVPLRVSPEVVRATVDSVGLRCTHIDAYRFYTQAALPLNATVPTRAGQPEQDQPGCLHTAMDLYKYAFWFSPLVSSELVADCFENARGARTLDMRASPYDVSGFGLQPIRVETAEGRREYAEEQQRLMTVTEPLRDRLLEALRGLQAAETTRCTTMPT